MQPADTVSKSKSGLTRCTSCHTCAECNIPFTTNKMVPGHKTCNKCYSNASLERCLPEAMLVSFGAQVAGFGGLSWRFGWLFGLYVGSCGAQMGVWEAQRLQGGGLEGLGLAQGRLGTRIWVQHGSNLRQVGGNLGPPWVQLEPTWSQLGSM